MWEAAAPKIAAGTLRAIFIECSYNDSVDDAYLYGHMCPRHLVAELMVLAKKVMEARDAEHADRKRKRNNSEPPSEQVSPRSKRNKSSSKSGPASSGNQWSYFSSAQYVAQLPELARDDLVGFGEAARVDDNEVPDASGWADADPLPLAGLSVYIIHIKEYLTDGPPPSDRILRELQEHGKETHLGCEFVIPNPSEGIFI